jgi:hypothetical protein
MVLSTRRTKLVEEQAPADEQAPQAPSSQQGDENLSSDSDEAPEEVDFQSGKAAAQESRQQERQTRTAAAQKAKSQRREVEVKRQELKAQQTEEQAAKRKGRQEAAEQRATVGNQGEEGLQGSGYALEEDLLPQEVLDQLQQQRWVTCALS